MTSPKLGADDFIASGLPEADLEDLPRAPVAEEPTLTRHGEQFTLDWPASQVTMRLSALREQYDGISSEIYIRLQGQDLHWGRLGLASTSGREAVIKILTKTHARLPWRQYIDRACWLTADAIRQGTPTVTLVPRIATGPRDLVTPIAPLGETSIVFGDGGAGKGWLTAFLALAVHAGAELPCGIRATQRTGVLFCDWESCLEDFEERIFLASRGVGCSGEGLHYRRMSRPIADELPALRVDVDRLGIGLVVVDSLVPAAGPEPEGADAAARTMNALRALGAGVTRLVVAHMTNAAANQPRGASRPFGSVFYWNLARSVWEVRKSDHDGEDMVLGLYHRKVNRGRLHPPLSLRFAFAPDAVTIHQADLGEQPDLLARSSLALRIRLIIQPSAKTAEEIAEALEASPDSIRRILRRLAVKGQVLRVEGDGRTHRWGLPA